MAMRSPEIPAEQWWLDLARELLEEDKRRGRNLTQLGVDLAKGIGRATPFHHTQLSRFKTGDIGATMELADALVREFVDLPCAYLIPKSREESLALMHTASRYRTGNAPPASTNAAVVPFEKSKTSRKAEPHAAATKARARK